LGSAGPKKPFLNQNTTVTKKIQIVIVQITKSGTSTPKKPRKKVVFQPLWNVLSHFKTLRNKQNKMLKIKRLNNKTLVATMARACLQKKINQRCLKSNKLLTKLLTISSKTTIAQVFASLLCSS